MKRFTKLFMALDATGKTSTKVQALADYFRSVAPVDGAWALAILSGHRPRGTPSTRALKEVAAETTGFPEWLIRECQGATGDFSEALALMLGSDANQEGANEPLHRVMSDRVLPLANANEEQKKRILREALASFAGDERFVYLKIVRGGLRLGVQRRTVARALASIAGVDQAVMLHRLAGGVPPTPEAFQDLLSPEGAEADTLRPYPFFLAHQLDAEPSTLGPIGKWRIEPKWDGVRAQLCVRPDAVMIWSRGEEVVTHQFPEIEAGARDLLRRLAGREGSEGFVLDGEVVAWRAGAPRPFAALQTRLNRKAAPTHQLGLFERDTVAFLAFDALEIDGRDLRAQPLRERVRMLEGLVETSADDATIRPCRAIEVPTWEAVAEYREAARESGVEGVMLKHLDSVYAAGRVKPESGSGWWKWKVDPLTVDCVLMYAQLGSGRRAGLYTDYTFGVWEEAEHAAPRRLTTFAKAYSGLTQAEIESLDGWIRAHTTRRYGPVREVEPVRVFELGFDSIRESDRHKSGLAVRFPRILRERTDKPAAEADTVATLRALLEGGAETR